MKASHKANSDRRVGGGGGGMVVSICLKGREQHACTGMGEVSVVLLWKQVFT